MKARVELWVRLKVVDLVSQTAWMTLVEKLELGDDLRGLVHYSYWGMDAEGSDGMTILNEIDRVVRMDSAFTNQNKHLYRLIVEGGGSTGDLVLEKDFPMNVAAKHQSERGGIFSFDCLVRELHSNREEGFKKRLNARLKAVSVSDLKAGEVWRVIIRGRNEDEAAKRIKEMIITRSRREGLLLNPHYQGFEIISSTRLEKERNDPKGRVGTAGINPARKRV